MGIKTIIIEDEEPARLLVKKYMEAHPEIELIGEYGDGFSGLKAINELKPQLLFLDIQLPKLTGFEILELVNHSPVLVFATAYDQFAIKAFELNAVDYLLKPFSQERFDVSVKKALDKIKKQVSSEEEVKTIIKATDELTDSIDRIVVKGNNKIKIIPINTISYIEAQDDYVMIYTEEGKFLKEKTMKYFETHLPKNDFIRVHRSYIVNVNRIARIEQFNKDSHILILKDNTKLKVSDSGYKNIKAILKF